MSPLWWYIAGVVTLPALFVAWLVIGSVVSIVTGHGTLTLRTKVDGRVVSERTWPR